MGMILCKSAPGLIASVTLSLSNRDNSVTKLFCIMPKRTRVEKESDNNNSFFDLILNASRSVDIFSDGDSEKKEKLTAIKKRLISDLSNSSKEQSKATTDFTLREAIETFGLKFVRTLGKFERNHEWDIEEDVGEEEFPTTPCISETLMPPCCTIDRSCNHF